jgi:hypothetical protein
VAILFWKNISGTSEEHPKCNDAERELIGADDVDFSGGASESSGPPPFPPFGLLVKSGNMWLMCVLSFGINIGWVFLVTWLPTYLKDVKNVDRKTGGLMSSLLFSSGYLIAAIGINTDRKVE